MMVITNHVGECQALVVGDAADFLEDEGVWPADWGEGDEDLGVCGGESAEDGEGGGELHVCCPARLQVAG